MINGALYSGFIELLLILNFNCTSINNHIFLAAKPTNYQLFQMLDTMDHCADETGIIHGIKHRQEHNSHVHIINR